MGVFDLMKKDVALEPSVLQRIAEIAKQADLRRVVELLPFLPPPTSPYGPAAASAVKALVLAASPEEIASFDHSYREQAHSVVRRVPLPSWGNWDSLRLGPSAWTGQYPTTVAIATCHQSGYVREKAVLALGESRDGMELPFLLLRLNDWVPEVRFVAGKAVRARIDVAHARAWVRCLGLLERIQRGQRSNQDWLTVPVETLLCRPECRAALQGGLVSGSPDVRRACVRIAANLAEADSTCLLRLALQDPDPVTSASAADVLCKRLDGDPLREALTIMQRGSAHARCLALETRCERFPEEAEGFLRTALLDHATSVRELARFKWEKLGLPRLPFATFYRTQLETQTGDLFITALRGLAETGAIEDVPVFLRYVDHRRARIREGAILGLGRCDGQNQGDVLVKALADKNLRVVKAAHRYARVYLGRRAISRRPQRPQKAPQPQKATPSPPDPDVMPGVPWLRR